MGFDAARCIYHELDLQRFIAAGSYLAFLTDGRPSSEHDMKLDCPAQRLLILALRNQIKAWRDQSDSGKLGEDEESDLQNDIGYAFTLLSEMEAEFFREFGFHAQ